MPYLNPAQKIALSTYEEGDFEFLEEELKSAPDITAFDGLGDTLLSFILKELDLTEGCDGFPEAVRRLEKAELQLLTVRHAIARQA